MQRTLFDLMDEKQEENIDEETPLEEPEKRFKFAPTGDCVFREGNKCLKTGKIIALDVRNPKKTSCWEKMNCDFFKKKEDKI